MYYLYMDLVGAHCGGAVDCRTQPEQDFARAPISRPIARGWDAGSTVRVSRWGRWGTSPAIWLTSGKPSEGPTPSGSRLTPSHVATV
jgi:hypothetical protein